MSAGKVVLALDGMGGDHAPDVVVNGADIARERYPDTSLPAVRRSGAAEAAGRQAQGPRRRRSRSCRPRTPCIADDKPSFALRRRRKSSMWLAVEAAAQGRADTRRLGRQHRRAAGDLDVRHAHARGRAPAGARLVPADRARRDGDARSRRQPRMRCRQPRRVRRHGQRLRPGAARPRRAQGRPAERRLRGAQGPRGAAPGGRPGCAAKARRSTSTASSRATTSAPGMVDVVVTDGFTGNVALKAIEGTAKLYTGSCATPSGPRPSPRSATCSPRAPGSSCASGSIRGATMAACSWGSTASA